MTAFVLALVLSTTSRHVAVAQADADASPTVLESVVRDALRAAAPLDTIETREDVLRAVADQSHLGDATQAEAAQVCGLACAFGRDGLVTVEQVVIDGHHLVRLAVFRPDDATPLGEVTMPVEQAKAAAVQALRLLSTRR